MSHKKGLRKRERESVKRALGIGDSLSVDVDDEIYFEELDSGAVFGLCPCCNSELVKGLDDFRCHSCGFSFFK